MAWHDVATEVIGHTSTVSIMVYIKAMLDEGKDPYAERQRILGARKREAEAKEARASKAQWLPLKPGLPCRKEAWLEQHKDAVMTYSATFELRKSNGQQAVYAVDITTSKNNARGAETFVEQHAKKLMKDGTAASVIVKSCKPSPEPKLDVAVPLC